MRSLPGKKVRDGHDADGLDGDGLDGDVHDGDGHDGDGHNGDGHDGVDDIVTEKTWLAWGQSQQIAP